MNQRPWPFSFLAVTFALIAVSFPLQSAYLFELPFYALFAQLQKLTWMNWVLLLGFALQVPLLLRAHRSLYLTMPLTMALVLVNNYYVGYYSFQYSLATTSISSLYFLAISAVLFLPESRFILNHQSKRWWLAPKREKVIVPLRMYSPTQPVASAKTYDLSASGAFISLDPADIQENYEVGQSIDLDMVLDELVHLKTQAEVVRIATEEQGRYPAGVGVKFTSLGKTEKRLLSERIH